MMDVESWLQRVLDFKGEIIEHIGRSAIALERIADSLAGIAKQNEVPELPEILKQHSEHIGDILKSILDNEEFTPGMRSIALRDFQKGLETAKI